LLLFTALVLAHGVLPDASASDDRLIELLHENLAGAGIDESAVMITELEGIVTLVGRVENGSVKSTIIDVVRRTHGVVDVVDRLSIDYQ
jgi:osmotically-inducible protein OsmY